MQQDMRIWDTNDGTRKGIVLMARVKGTCEIGKITLKNAMRYMVITITHDAESCEFTLAAVDDHEKPTSQPFTMTQEQLANTMRLTHSFTYYSAQARTIRGPLRLCNTDHKHFTLRHLIVGLGRAPTGSCVEVM